MYPERLDIWRRGQALTAARLNKTVQAVNYLLSLSAEQDADQPNGGATKINVAPPGGYIPPEPSFANPPADDITALAQPFKFVGNPLVQIKTPPVYGASPSVPVFDENTTPYYINIATDEFGRILSVTPSESEASYYFWDGNTTNGNLSILTGALGVNSYGEPYSIDCNPVSLPVIPVNAAPSDATAASLVAGITGNSALIKALKTDNSLRIDDEGTALKLSLQAGAINNVIYNLTSSAPTVANGSITINGAQPNAAGVVSGVRVTQYDSSNPSYAESPPQSKIQNGIIDIFVPHAGNVENLSVTYDLSAPGPIVMNGEIRLNGASFDPSDPSVTPAPGVISSASAEYYTPPDPSEPGADQPPQPSLKNGQLNIKIPKPTASITALQNVTSTQGSTAAPGVDGWIQTMYIYGVWSGQMDYYEYLRQLMRLHDGALQIVTQRSADGMTWYPQT